MARVRTWRARPKAGRSRGQWWWVLSCVGSTAVTPPAPGPHLNLQIEGADGRVTETAMAVRQLLLAGYTGRNRHAVTAHVRELEALGVAPPDRIPSVFVVDPWSVQVTDVIEASGPETSGEVEVVLLRGDEGLLVGVGSDHTDWDELELRSWTTEGIDRRLYQEGTLAEFLPVDELQDELRDAGFDDRGGTVVFGGTLPTLGGLAFGQRFEIELRDPVLDRSISWSYLVSGPR